MNGMSVKIRGKGTLSINGLLAIFLVFNLVIPGNGFSAPGHPATASDSQTGIKDQAGDQSQVDERIDLSTEEKTDEARADLIEGAVSAVEMTVKALSLLSEDKPKIEEAIGELEKVVGKLEIQMARDPELALLPVAVDVYSTDVFAQAESVERLAKEARKALDKGHIQEARHLMDGLASEYVISTKLLPLATYPDAIRKAVGLIDDGRIDDAKRQIQTSLNLLFVDEIIYPLPVLRAQAMLSTAQDLLEKSDRDEQDNQKISELLVSARREIEYGKALGYFDKKETKSILKEIRKIEAQTSQGENGNTILSFNKLKEMIDHLM